jgi:hypothetical protein
MRATSPPKKEKRPAGVTPPASLAAAGSGPVPLRFHAEILRESG